MVNGKDQGKGFGIRSPLSNSPVTDVKSAAMTCNTNNVPVAGYVKVNVSACTASTRIID